MITPKKLYTGARVAMISLSGPVPEGRYNAAVTAVENLGLIPVMGESFTTRHGYLAGDDAIRARDFNCMFADSTIDGIFCVRGGYGVQRILDKIDFDIVRTNPKVFSGYSDVTALHIALNQFCGLVTYHSPMAASELFAGSDGYTLKSFTENIFTNKTPNFANTPEDELKILRGGIAEGILTGGNLTMLVSSMGTPYEIDTKGKILFIEEINEEPYRLDRMLNQLRLGGKFRDCAGVMFGKFTACDAKTPEKSLTISDIISELVLPENKPTVSGLACGHTLPTLTLPLGTVITLDANRGIITSGVGKYA